MDADSLLEELAEDLGLGMEYSDVWGEKRRISKETRNKLLSSLGVPTSSKEALAVFLAERRSRQARRVLRAAQVVRSGHEIRIELIIPRGNENRSLDWEISLESGQTRTGTLRPSALDKIGSLVADGEEFCSFCFQFEANLPEGYHRFSISAADGSAALRAEMRLVVVPERCYEPESMARGGRLWGLMAQLYSLRSRRNWGVGDFSDLRRLVEIAASHGASLVGLNPLHAQFMDNPAHCSPYSPSCRVLWSVTYIDPELIEEYSSCPQAEIEELLARKEEVRAAELIDYVKVCRLKNEVLELLFRSFSDRHLGDKLTPRGRSFRSWVAEQGPAVQIHATHEALREHFYPPGSSEGGSRDWPEEYRDADSEAVRRFTREHGHRIDFFLFVQWQADLQLGGVAQRARELGMETGLFFDLAVSADRSGSEVWRHRNVFAPDVDVGAPPDRLAPQGQNWGLPPFSPQALAEAGYEPFAEIVRANMRHAGALRIDHVMGLLRLYWIPSQAPAAEGAYMHYPFEDLVGIIALESQRNRCLVVGEDLGTVPPGIRSDLASRGILSYRLLLFGKNEDGSFSDPATYPRQSLAALSTHDLPTAAGFWSFRDLQWRRILGLFADPSRERRETESRLEAKLGFVRAIEKLNIGPREKSSSGQVQAAIDTEILLGLHLLLAGSNSAASVFQLEDLIGQIEQANLPGTIDEHPNWRRRMALDIEDFADLEILSAVGREFRPTSGQSSAGRSDNQDY